MKQVKVGLIGCGYIAHLHMYAFKRVYGVDAKVVAIAARGDHVTDFAKQYGIPNIYRNYKDLLADKNIDVVDICTPADLHAGMVVEAMRAGKHVICEKPFTGYFGRSGDEKPIGRRVPKSLMYERVMQEMEETKRQIQATGKLFMYAENWVYMPAITKTADMLRATKDKVLFMKAEASHSGSHAEHAARWDISGGGVLIRQGCHPLSAVLYLKQVEAKSRGEAISITDIVCDVGNVGDSLKEEDHRYVLSHPIDVEDWAIMNITFSDQTKATVFAGDMVLGGVRNLVETFTSGGTLLANAAPNNHIVSYMTDEQKLKDIYITEKVDRKTGWQFVSVQEEWTRGYVQEIQDFIECAANGHEPLAGLDLAVSTMQATYAAYWSAEEGRRIKL